MLYIILLANGLVFGIGCRYLAEEKGKDQTIWFGIGFFLGIVGLLILGFSKNEVNNDKLPNVVNLNSINEKTNSTFSDIRFVDLNAPIEVQKIQIKISEDTSKTYCSVQFFNLSDKYVTSVKFKICCFDSFFKPVGNPNFIETIIQDEEARPGTCFGFQKNIALTDHQTTRNVDIIIQKVLFSDNSIWESENKELIEVNNPQISNSELARIKQIVGVDAVCYAKNSAYTWTCVCGRINKDIQKKCIRCSRDKDQVLTNYLSKQSVDKVIEKIEKDKCNAEIQKKEAKEIKKEKIKKQIKRIIPISVIAFLVCIIGCYAFKTDFTFSYNRYKFNQLEKNSTLPLIMAVKNNQIEDAKLCIDYGIDINSKDKDGKTALMEAVSSKNSDINCIKYLISKGANINASDKMGLCVLDYAILSAEKNNIKIIEIIKLLIADGVDVNAQSNTGEPPLYFAITSNQIDKVKILVDNGANVHEKDNTNTEMLDYITTYKMTEAMTEN